MTKQEAIEYLMDPIGKSLETHEQAVNLAVEALKEATRFYVLKDGTLVASAGTKEDATSLVKAYKELDTWFIEPEYMIIEGKYPEFIK